MKVIKTGNIILNKAKCLKCSEVLESNGVITFSSCRCGNVSIDGGKDSIRHEWFDESNYQNLSEYSEEEKEVKKEALRL